MGSCSAKSSFHVSVCLASLGGSGLPCDLGCLMDVGRAVDVYFVPLSPRWVGVTASKLLPCQAGRWKSLSLFF